MVSLRENVVLTESSDGSGVLLDEKDGAYWQLNYTGFSALKQILEGVPESEIAKSLIRPNVDMTEVLQDIGALKEQLFENGLLVNR